MVLEVIAGFILGFCAVKSKPDTVKKHLSLTYPPKILTIGPKRPLKISELA